jgi:hypothetical protein
MCIDIRKSFGGMLILTDVLQQSREISCEFQNASLKLDPYQYGNLCSCYLINSSSAGLQRISHKNKSKSKVILVTGRGDL